MAIKIRTQCLKTSANFYTFVASRNKKIWSSCIGKTESSILAKKYIRNFRCIGTLSISEIKYEVTTSNFALNESLFAKIRIREKVDSLASLKAVL